jgi:hypothetical protein
LCCLALYKKCRGFVNQWKASLKWDAFFLF